MNRRLPVALALLPLLAGLAGCGSGTQPGSGSGSSSGGTVTVLAAASLTGAFDTLAHRFETQHPDSHVRLSFDSSATLAEQVVQGAPADVLATADTRTMHTVTAAGDQAAAPQRFATNTMVLVVPEQNPAHLTSFSGLDRPGVRYVTCVASAPCGDLGMRLLKADHVGAKPVSTEVDVKSVLSKVELGEADAGLVYATDARAAAGKVRALPVPHAHDPAYINDYPIATLKGSARPALARAWVRLVLSAQGQKVLRAAGFGAP